MNTQSNDHINKVHIQRKLLTWQRIFIRNDTTLLSLIRTALYFSIAGRLVNRLLATMQVANKLNYQLE